MWDVVSDVVRDRLMLMGTLMSARPRDVKLVLAHSFPFLNSFIPPQKRLIYLDIHTP